jgi:4-amino-4-deoxy-L-arabinose transferase-like glycosyltransferase
LLALALGLRLQVAWSDLYLLIRDVTSDDAYYYFQIARNWVGGAGVSFDGETVTNGFHPLWLLLLTPVLAAVDDATGTLHWGLSLSAVLATGSVALVYAALRELSVRPAAALLAAAVYAVHPTVVVESVNGMETGVAVFCTACVVWGFLRLAREPQPALGAYAALGVAAGFMMLARTDSLFVLPPVALFFFLRERGARRWQSAFALGLAAGAVLLPWIVWNLASFGTLVQISSVAIAGMHQDVWLAEHGTDLGPRLARAWDMTRGAFGAQLVHLYALPRGSSRLFLVAGLALLAAFAFASPADARRRASRQLGLLLVPGSGIVLGLVVHAAVRWWLREWYFAPTGLLLALLLGVVFDWVGAALAAARGPRAASVAYAACALALLVLLGPPLRERWTGPSPHRVNQLEAARWIDAYTPPDARVGSFNAGIVGYFSNRHVTNLDGVVNADAYRARRQKALPAYMREQKLDYLVDLNPALLNLACWSGPDAWCEIVTVVGEPHAALGGGRVSILALWPGDRPDTLPAEGGP